MNNDTQKVNRNSLKTGDLLMDAAIEATINRKRSTKYHRLTMGAAIGADKLFNVWRYLVKQRMNGGHEVMWDAGMIDATSVVLQKRQLLLELLQYETAVQDIDVDEYKR